MGLRQSCQGKPEVTPADPGLMDDYLALETRISREESEVPGPALSHSLVRLDLLQAQVDIATERLQRFRRTDGSDESLREVLAQLLIDRNERVSLEHEEFIANINRQALAKSEVDFLSQRAEEAEEESKILSAKVAYLQDLYQQQDQLLAGISDEAYGNSDEVQLEKELDKLRNYRDTLAGGALEWQEASAHIHAATELLERAVQCWNMLDTQTVEMRFHLATDARNAMQEAALGVQTAQDLLSGVQFPYCTTREVTAVLQSIVYIFTDIQIKDRYAHAGLCYSNFHQRAIALGQWMNQTIEQSLRKDLDDVDGQVSEVTSRLRNMRISLIRHKMDDTSEISLGTPSTDGHLSAYPVAGERLRSQPYGYETQAFQQLDHSALFPANHGAANTHHLPSHTKLPKNTKKSKDYKRGPNSKLFETGTLWSSRRVEEMQANLTNQTQPNNRRY